MRPRFLTIARLMAITLVAEHAGLLQMVGWNMARFSKGDGRLLIPEPLHRRSGHGRALHERPRGAHLHAHGHRRDLLLLPHDHPVARIMAMSIADLELTVGLRRILAFAAPIGRSPSRGSWPPSPC